MANATPALREFPSDGGGSYLIQVYGKVARHWEAELRMRLAYTQTEWGTITTLTGWLPDQAALLGALGRLSMWGYLIIIVRYNVGQDA